MMKTPKMGALPCKSKPPRHLVEATTNGRGDWQASVLSALEYPWDWQNSVFSAPPPGPLETGGAQAVSGPQLAWGLAELDYLSPPPGSLGTGGTQLFSPRVSPQVPWGTGVTPAL